MPADGVVTEGVIGFIYDLSGREIRSIALTGLTYGVDYYQPIDMTGLNGLYIVRIASDRFSIATKLQ